MEGITIIYAPSFILDQGKAVWNDIITELLPHVLKYNPSFRCWSVLELLDWPSILKNMCFCPEISNISRHSVSLVLEGSIRHWIAKEDNFSFHEPSTNRKVKNLSGLAECYGKFIPCIAEHSAVSNILIRAHHQTNYRGLKSVAKISKNSKMPQGIWILRICLVFQQMPLESDLMVCYIKWMKKNKAVCFWVASFYRSYIWCLRKSV